MMDLAYPTEGNIRAEVERAPAPINEWWRARVVGGVGWRVWDPLPWSYDLSETMAVEAALSLWMSAGKPGLHDPSGDEEGQAHSPEPLLQIAARTRQAQTTIVTAAVDGATVREYPIAQPLEIAVRALASAVERGVGAIALTAEEGATREVEIASVIGLRGAPPPGRPRKMPKRERPTVVSEPARAARSASREAPSLDEPASRGVARAQPARSG